MYSNDVSSRSIPSPRVGRGELAWRQTRLCSAPLASRLFDRRSLCRSRPGPSSSSSFSTCLACSLALILPSSPRHYLLLCGFDTPHLTFGVLPVRAFLPALLSRWSFTVSRLCLPNLSDAPSTSTQGLKFLRSWSRRGGRSRSWSIIHEPVYRRRVCCLLTAHCSLLTVIEEVASGAPRSA